MTREEWLVERNKGIGASDASAVIGRNPYKTNVELWLEKRGQLIPADISNKPYVKYGVEAEAPLRQLFALDFPKYEVSYSEFDVVRHQKYPFIFATLDGRLVDRETGRKGILEIKTTEVMSSKSKESWDGRVPDNYYIQICHQLLATGWDFAILKAQLKFKFPDSLHLQTRHYTIERAEVQQDIDFLLGKEIEFWRNYVHQDRRPNTILPEI
jgi:putative phage-type endonuclease